MTDMHTGNDETPNAAPKGPKGPHLPRRTLAGVAAIAVLALGVAGGAGAVKLMGPQVEMAPLTPVAISALPQDSLVTIKGTVAEIFGNKFVLQDQTGRMLVETGRAGEGGKLVAKDQPVTVQGRFDDGFLKASYIVYADGRTEAIGPAGGPPRGPGDEGPGPKHGPHGPKHDGPKGGPDLARPDPARPDRAGPDQAGPSADGPDAGGPDLGGPDAGGPAALGPARAGPLPGDGLPAPDAPQTPAAPGAAPEATPGRVL